jgi:hypothetical protein
MILNAGDKILVAHRRLFPHDQPRFFVAAVEEYDAGIVVASGYSWVRDAFSGAYVRKEDARTKVLSLASGSVLVYRLPKTTAVSETRIEAAGEHGHVLTDAAGFRMDLSERLPRGGSASQAA